ncbi:MAG TPA: hypothetical protein V6C86_04905 [Oculatellaceae cyanobacterium]
MTPSRILKVYYAVTFAIGIIFTVPLAFLVQTTEVGARGAAIMTLSWNVLFVMLLPIIMDIGERMYYKARFVQLEEIAANNPELAAVIEDRCKSLHIAGCRFAVIDSVDTEVFSYGLWRNNPRLVVPELLLTNEQTNVIPSIEKELLRFSRTEPTLIFLGFAVAQIALQHMLMFFLH